MWYLIFGALVMAAAAVIMAKNDTWSISQEINKF